jgi:hypothetical protein
MTRAILVCLAVLCMPSVALAAYGKFDLTASHVHLVPVTINANETVTFDTYDIAPTGGDTVMHLLAPSGQEVAQNDDWNGTLASHIQYTAPTTGTYTVVIRAFSSYNSGTCSLKKNGVPLQTGFPFAGGSLATNTISSDFVQTALLYGGTDDTVLIGLNGSNQIIGMNDDRGVGFASKLTGAFYRVLISTSRPMVGRRARRV